MPYIAESLQGPLRPVAYVEAQNVGELTFQLQAVAERYLLKKRLSYQTIAEITGALAQTQRDFDERIVEPYEAQKREQNGDVWLGSEAYR